LEEPNLTLAGLKMEFDWNKVTESKKAYRRRLAALPITEKLRLLDGLRERAVAIRGANHRQRSEVREQPPDYGDSKGAK